MPIENYIQTIDVNLSRGYGDCNILLNPMFTRTDTYKGPTSILWNAVPSPATLLNGYSVKIMLYKTPESSSLDSFQNGLMFQYNSKQHQSRYAMLTLCLSNSRF